MPACKRNVYDTRSINLDASRYISEIVQPSQQIFYPNTNSGYGIAGENFCTEESKLSPISLYGITKCDAEREFLNKGNAVSFRLATVFGLSNRMRLDLLVNDFVYRAFTDNSIVLFESHFKRNFIHVRDVCNAFLFGIKNYDKMRGEPYNAGLSSANLSKYELCERIKKYFPNLIIQEADIGEDPDKRNYIVSNEKLESLGWSCNYNLDRGIRRLLSGYSVLNYNKEFMNV
jgi:nucleoside-diphosphate-sugar epimerase